VNQKRKGRPVSALINQQTSGRPNSNGSASRRPETIDQAKRCDVQKSRAKAHGLCDRCAGQYAWGLQTGFANSRPPCSTCAVIVDATPGEARPNGWTNMRLRNVEGVDTEDVPHAHASRLREPAMGRHGYARCQCGTSWTGFDVCHCAGCHHTFTCERAFARHRLAGNCCRPERRGLVEIGRVFFKAWGFPAERDRKERIRG
jgi:hypothetical protein